MIICERCAAANNSEHSFCCHCGAKLSPGRDAVAVGLEGYRDEKVVKKKKKMPVIIGTGAAILIIIALAWPTPQKKLVGEWASGRQTVSFYRDGTYQFSPYGTRIWKKMGDDGNYKIRSDKTLYIKTKDIGAVFEGASSNNLKWNEDWLISDNYLLLFGEEFERVK